MTGLGLGRIQPATKAPGSVEEAIGPPSAEVLRQLHGDLVARKRRAFITSSPLLLLAGLALAGAITDPAHLGGLGIFSTVTTALVLQVGYGWLTLRRADPVDLYQRERRLEEEGRQQRLEHLERTAAIRPFASLALVACIVSVTIVEFAWGPPSKSVAVAGLVKPAVRAGQWWRLLTASYLHGGLFHLLANANALLILGRIVETYDRRLRLPLVYLAGVVGASLVSTLMSSKSAVGASGGALAIAGYLLVIAGRDPHGIPAWIRKQMLAIMASTAVLGIGAFAFIDNGGHLGGAVTGALLGLVIARWPADAARSLDAAGALSAIVLAGGAVLTITRLVFA